ncbi:hypothetical protein BASA81_003334 [Batrachochytrium salamandrivorans]|nr:hypothetical protein BASA81_003334 [Batrachochytrium salamandrivorans]
MPQVSGGHEGFLACPRGLEWCGSLEEPCLLCDLLHRAGRTISHFEALSPPLLGIQLVLYLKGNLSANGMFFFGFRDGFPKHAQMFTKPAVCLVAALLLLSTRAVTAENRLNRQATLLNELAGEFKRDAASSVQRANQLTGFFQEHIRYNLRKCSSS